MPVNAIWVQAAAVAANTAYAIPSEALPEGAYVTGVRMVSIAPVAASTTAPIKEVYTSGAPAAGQVALSVANQELTSGDAIPANSVIVANVLTMGE